eukprot:m.33156 g.33156  ORF g.33156 m.33156 type:complete len:586 (+) comp9586_c1_seq1:221-1978(+)
MDVEQLSALVRDVTVNKTRDPGKYWRVVQQFSDALKAQDLDVVRVWLQSLNQCVSCFDKERSDLVDLTLKLDMTALDEETQILLMQFVSAVVSSCSLYGDAVLEYLFACLKTELASERVRTAISDMVREVPSLMRTLPRIALKAMPNKRRDKQSQQTFFTNMFELVLEAQQLLEPLFTIAVKHLLQIDAELAESEADGVGLKKGLAGLAASGSAAGQGDVEHGAAADEEEEEDDETFMFDEDLQQQQEEEAAQVDSEELAGLDGTAQPSEEETPAQPEDDPESYVSKLDALLQLTLEFVYIMMREPGEERAAMFQTLINVFDSTILLAYRPRNVQYLLFYACHFDPELSIAFLEHVWDLATTVSAPSLTRQICFAYVASFLARAQFATPHMVVEGLQLLQKWCLEYSEQAADTHIPQRHVMFYAAAQAVLYIVCFRCQAIMREETGEEFLRSLQLEQLIQSQLNPLRECQADVVAEFADIAQRYQLVLCEPYLTRNRRSTSSLPTVAISSTVVAERVEDYFPFDPMKLPMCASHFGELYIDWDEISAAFDPSLVTPQPSLCDEDYLPKQSSFSLNARSFSATLSM